MQFQSRGKVHLFILTIYPHSLALDQAFKTRTISFRLVPAPLAICLTHVPFVEVRLVRCG